MTDSELSEVLRNANSEDESLKDASRSALRNLEMHDVRRADLLLDQWSTMHSNATGAGCMLWVALIATVALFLSGLNILQRTTLFGIAALIVGAIFLVSLGRRRSLPNYEADALRVELGKDVPANAARLIDHLIDGSQEFTAHAAAYSRITSILPIIGPEDLSQPQRQWLVQFLDIGNVYVSEELLAEILDFFARTRAVEAHGRIKTFTAYHAVSARALRLQQKARQCLSALDPLLEQAKLSGSLLRASDAPPNSLLLRPAGDASTQEKVLLRPIEPRDPR